jgi:hypothetical protein
MNYNAIPLDERTALLNAYLCHGRKARWMIHKAWFDGNYRDFASVIDYAALQRFRNSEHGGPTTLHRIVWKQLKASMPAIVI